MAYLITIPKEHKQEITQILRTTASLKDAKLDLLSCGTLGDDVDLLIDTDLDGWDVDGILEAHLDGAGYSFDTKGPRFMMGTIGQEMANITAAEVRALVAAQARAAHPLRAHHIGSPVGGSPKQMPIPHIKGGKAK